MIYLIFVAIAIIVGVTIVVIRHRGPSGLHHGINDFEKRREALAPRPKSSLFRHHKDNSDGA